MASVTVFRTDKFQIRVHWSVIPAALGLWLLLTMAGQLWLDWPLAQTVWGGLIATLFLLDGELVHHLGHAWAAQRTGYPMSGIRLWALLGTSIYPKDEPTLPAAIHRRRAWGGPIISFLSGLLYGVIALLLRDISPFWYTIFLFAAVVNTLVFALGALLPLGFTDGSTLIHYWQD